MWWGEFGWLGLGRVGYVRVVHMISAQGRVGVRGRVGWVGG